jgi:SAM-dependent methyltransferase
MRRRRQRRLVDSAMNATLKRREDVDGAIRALRSLGLRPHPDTYEKNWDLWLAIDFIRTTVPKNAALLDAGARWSPILRRLESLGYQELWACDLKGSPRETLQRIVSGSKIRFVKADLTRTPFPDQTFAAVTCVSVIEHGVQPEDYFREMARILQPGGYLITSTDYWCEPVDTRGIFPYGPAFGEMRIFDPDGIRELVRKAGMHGFQLKQSLALDTEEKVVHWERVNRDFTFIFFVLQRE